MTKSSIWHENIFNIAMYISYFLYIVAFTGILIIDSKYLELLNSIITFYIGIVLFIRFNPWSNFKTYSKFDRRLVWSAGGFLLLSSSITAAIQAYINKFIKT